MVPQSANMKSANCKSAPSRVRCDTRSRSTVPGIIGMRCVISFCSVSIYNFSAVHDSLAPVVHWHSLVVGTRWPYSWSWKSGQSRARPQHHAKAAKRPEPSLYGAWEVWQTGTYSHFSASSRSHHFLVKLSRSCSKLAQN